MAVTISGGLGFAPTGYTIFKDSADCELMYKITFLQVFYYTFIVKKFQH